MAIISLPNRASKPLLTSEQVNKLLQKTAKGTVTSLAKYAERSLKYYTLIDLYKRPSSYFTGKEKPSKYVRTNALYGSITRLRTDGEEGNYFSSVIFDENVLASNTSKKTKDTLGAHVNVSGYFVGDDLIDYKWIDEGTLGTSSRVPRKGANMVSDTIEDIENFINKNGIESYVYSELGDVIIERVR